MIVQTCPKFINNYSFACCLCTVLLNNRWVILTSSGCFWQIGLQWFKCSDALDVSVTLLSVLCWLQGSHLAVIDALMAVAAVETVAAARTHTSADLLGGGCSWEDALLHWVNAVSRKPPVFHALLVYPVINLSWLQPLFDWYNRVVI